MSIARVLEVGIGLSFIYLLLALVASVLQELFASFVKLRGKYLVQGVSNLLANVDSDCWKARDNLHLQKIREFSNPKPGQKLVGSPLFLKVVRHPLFRELAPKSMPSYISPRNFALSLLDALKDDAALTAELKSLANALPQSAGKQTLIADLAAAGKTFDDNLISAKDALASLPPGPAQTTLADFVGRASIAPDRVMRRIEASVRALPQGAARTALMALLEDSSGQLTSFKASLETWFDDAMDRVSGVYKRFSQYFTLVFALAAVVLFNVNTFDIGNALWNNPELRRSLVESADSYLKECLKTPGEITTSGLSCPKAPLEEGEAEAADQNVGSQPASPPVAEANASPETQPPAEAPLAATDSAGPGAVAPAVPAPDMQTAQIPALPSQETGSDGDEPDPDQAATDAKAFEVSMTRYENTVTGVKQILDPLSLPIGWNPGPFEANGGAAGAWLPTLIWLLAGWLITAFAVSLGAPFWFDLLKLFMNLRGAGPKPGASNALKTTR